jgi:glutamyl-Q tRNA(Asp) synthetase
LGKLRELGLAYPCFCTRKDIQAALSAPHGHGEMIYPGTCRSLDSNEAAHRSADGKAHSWRLDSEKAAALHGAIHFTDLRCGTTQVDPAMNGDVVLARKDIGTSYHLAVVVDDAAQGITHIVRGEDLTDNTARQIVLQQALGLLTPSYMHTPLVLGENGEKLSKQNGAEALNLSHPLQALNEAAHALGLTPCATSMEDALHHWTQASLHKA